MKTAKKKNSHRRRNAAPSAPRPAPRRRRIPLPPIPDPPDWKTTVASVLGGGGSALVGGWLANRGWDQQMVGIAMTTGGAVGALALPGPWRVAANGIAASGAGQFALATVHKAAVNKAKKELEASVPKRNALPAAFGNALAGAMNDSGAGYPGSLDDEERMLDPDLDPDLDVGITATSKVDDSVVLDTVIARSDGTRRADDPAVAAVGVVHDPVVGAVLRT